MGLLNSVLKVFVGDKTKKDLAVILPIISEINKHFDSYNSLTNDQLRNKTGGFKDLLNKNLNEIESRVKRLKEELNRIDDIDQKENLYQQVDDLTINIREITADTL